MNSKQQRVSPQKKHTTEIHPKVPNANIYGGRAGPAPALPARSHPVDGISIDVWIEIIDKLEKSSMQRQQHMSEVGERDTQCTTIKQLLSVGHICANASAAAQILVRRRKRLCIVDTTLSSPAPLLSPVFEQHATLCTQITVLEISNNGIKGSGSSSSEQYAMLPNMFPLVTHFTVKWNERVTSSVVMTIADKWKRLQSFKLHEINKPIIETDAITGSTFTHVALALANSITKLAFNTADGWSIPKNKDDPQWMSGAAGPIDEALRHCKQLQTLSLRGWILPWEDELWRIAAGTPSLQHLDLSRCDGVDQLHTLLMSRPAVWPDLKVLCLNQTDIGWADLELISKMNPPLELLEIRGCNQFATNWANEWSRDRATYESEVASKFGCTIEEHLMAIESFRLDVPVTDIIARVDEGYVLHDHIDVAEIIQQIRDTGCEVDIEKEWI